jgi:hypothetical protein
MAVTGLAAREGRLFATIANLGTASASGEVRAAADGVPLDTRTLALDGGASADAVWPLPAAARVASVTVAADDAVPADDAASTAVVRPRVGQLVGSSEAVERALYSLPGWTISRAGRATYSVDGSADMSVFAGEAPEHLPPGGVLIVGAPDGAAAGPDPVVPETGSVRGLELLPVGSHPLVAGLDLAGVRVTPAAFEVPPWAHPILFAGGQGVGFAGERPGGRLVVLGFDPDDPGSSFAKRPSFPVLIARAADWLAPAAPGAVPAGALVELPGGEVTVSRPDGSRETASGRLYTDGPGLYGVRPVSAAPDARPFVFGAWAGAHSGTDAPVSDPLVMRAASAAEPVQATGATGSFAADAFESIGPSLAALALVIILAEGAWRALGGDDPGRLIGRSRPRAHDPAEAIR